MKILFLLLLAPSFSFGQQEPKKSTSTQSAATASELVRANVISLPTKEGKVFYESMDSSFKKSKADVYQSAKLWFGDAFKDSKNVLQVDDKESGELLGKGNFTFSIRVRGMDIENICQFTIHISCRDNKYRIQIYDILNRMVNIGKLEPIEKVNGSESELFQPMLQKIDASVSAIVNSSKIAIALTKDTF